MYGFKMKIISVIAISLLILTGCGSTGSGDSKTKEKQTQLQKPVSQNGIFTYNDLQWQDDETVRGSRVTYDERNNYCQSLTLGGYSDWRLPTVAEFDTLNTVKDKLHFAWDKENYLFWTANEGTAANKEYIRFYNLSNGRSDIWYVDKLKENNYDWNIRCVRSDKSSSDQASKKLYDVQVVSDKSLPDSQCKGATGLLIINSDKLSGTVTSEWGISYAITGTYLTGSHEIKGGFANGGKQVATFEGTADNSTADGTWRDDLGCYGTWSGTIR